MVAALEPRAAVADYDAASGRFTLHVGCQGVFGLRRALAEDLLRIEPERLRVLTGNVGGSFGMKAAAYPEYVAILHAARALGRPVKWCDERSDSFLSDQQGRGTIVEGELALDADGNFLAVRVYNLADMGAYLTAFGPMMPAVNMQKNLPSLYRTPVVAIAHPVRVHQHRADRPVPGRRPARGQLRAWSAWSTPPRARPGAIRRRSAAEPDPQGRHPLSCAPRASTTTAATFPPCSTPASAEADWAGFAARRARSEARGKLRGRGLACYLEVTAPPNPEMGGIRFEADGRVTIVTGTLDYGQGHASAFAQVLVDRLGLPFELIDLVQGDSDQLLVGGGTGGSRSIMASGKALVEAAAEVIEKGRALAGHFLEAATADIAFEAGEFRIAGTDRAIALLELAARTRRRPTCRTTCREPRCRADLRSRRRRRFPTAATSPRSRSIPRPARSVLDRYTAVDDFGTLVNPMLAEGQVHGGVAQGIGQALLEHAVYDGSGPAARRLVHGLRPAARRPRAGDRRRLPSGAGDHQSARRQGLRRGRGHRRPARGHERGARRAGGARRAPPRHAGDARADLAGVARGGKRPRLNGARTPCRPARRSSAGMGMEPRPAPPARLPLDVDRAACECPERSWPVACDIVWHGHLTSASGPQESRSGGDR